MKVLVTGADGFIGSHLTEMLYAEGHSVRALSQYNSFNNWGWLENIDCLNNIDVVSGDIRDKNFCNEISEDIEVIFHLAALIGIPYSYIAPDSYIETNIVGTSNICYAAMQKGVKQVIHTSTSEVYGTAQYVPIDELHPLVGQSPYAATKRAGELICHTYSHLFGISIICLRFFTVYGPGQRPDLAIHKFSRLMSDGESIPMFGDGSTERDYTYIGDIVDGVLRAVKWSLENPGAFEIVNLGESETISLSRMISEIADVLQCEPMIQTFPMQDGDVMRTYADVSKARELLGYSPSVSFDQGIRLFADWFKARYEVGHLERED